MKKKLLHFADFVDMLNRHVRYVGFIVIVIMFIVVFEIVARDVFTSPTKWAWTINQQLLCALVVTAGGTALLYKDHVRMDMLYTKWSSKTQLLIELISAFLPLLFCLILLGYGSKLLWDSIVTGEHSTGLFSIPRYPVRIIFLLGVFLLFLQVVAQFIRNLLDFVDLKNGKTIERKENK
jgi:TRAP-type mannitol/chloroaromatic compound transport system permease small subunit